jgi:hypothetical protein
MKGFLFDENLPSRLKFAPSLPVIAATSVGPSPTDSASWEFARNGELVIVTKERTSQTESSSISLRRGLYICVLETCVGTTFIRCSRAFGRKSNNC